MNVRLIDRERGLVQPPRYREALTFEEARELARCNFKWLGVKRAEEKARREAGEVEYERRRVRVEREVAVLLFVCVAQAKAPYGFYAIAYVAAAILLGWACWLAMGAVQPAVERLVAGRRKR